ncbi:hypothetical protein KIF75_02545 [Serratia ureilytica]|uniref:hypothetical protein n=1 Tax=Serratia ureilytica TaxID=300181 RepID=UPI001BCFC969|nr:hypothetical protein [Serratia ureilytica]MBS7518563.1 hypothetical protein [Serratia ureilytica]
MKRKTLIRQDVNLLKLSEQLDLLGEYPDREVAILGAAYVEICVDMSIEAALEKINGNRNFVRHVSELKLDFDRKRLLSLSLGMMKECVSLAVANIGNIRNTSAHCIQDFNFENSDVREKIGNIKLNEIFNIKNIVKEFDAHEVINLDEAEPIIHSTGREINSDEYVFLTDKHFRHYFRAPMLMERNYSSKEKFVLGVQLVCLWMIKKIAHTNFEQINRML